MISLRWGNICRLLLLLRKYLFCRGIQACGNLHHAAVIHKVRTVPVKQGRTYLIPIGIVAPLCHAPFRDIGATLRKILNKMSCKAYAKNPGRNAKIRILIRN